MEYKGLSLQDSVDYVINKWLEDSKGGLIAISSNGEAVARFNTMVLFIMGKESGFSSLLLSPLSPSEAM
ncbi:hypothetical protein SUGI_0397660 [Cryptomeria japonica]|nr:hypothetical protein SUGI_0397660 [Cryptomeria japonica]